jgi:hypothetical protein
MSGRRILPRVKGKANEGSFALPYELWRMK